MKKDGSAKDTVVSVRLPLSVADGLTKIAKEYTRTRANYIKVVLAEVVSRGGLAIRKGLQ